MHHFFVILKKELVDLLRDKKTIITGIIIPILLYPALIIGMNKFAESSFDMSKKNFNIAIEDNGASSIREVLKSQSNITIADEEDNDAALKDGDISLIIKVPQGFDESMASEKKEDISLKYDEQSQDSVLIKEAVGSILNVYAQNIAEGRLKARNIDTSILEPFSMSTENISTTSEEADDFSSGMMKGVMMMLPTVVVILLLAPTMGIAVDLCAGEKERQTMEPLLSTAANRMSIVWAKIVALAVVGIITLSCTLIAMGVSFKYFMNSTEMSFVNGRFIASMGVTCLFLVLALGALQIAMSIYARSIKEANSYLSTIYIASMILSYVPFAFDSKSIAAKYFNIPIINTVCLIKELMAGIFRTDHLLMVLGWNIVYTIISVMFARYMFSKEEVIFRS